MDSDYVSVNEEMADVAMEISNQSDPGRTVEAISKTVQDRLRYERGATVVSTSAVEAWQAGRGVCQDFAHVMLAMLRSVGVPCRYVSGYFHPSPKAEIGEEVEGASHAWIEAWVGSWWAVDPTNDGIAGERHVTVARGRDYTDVAPVRGIYQGGPSEELTVAVSLTRVA
jgi:transglutaminase-like putative cysteine protease